MVSTPTKKSSAKPKRATEVRVLCDYVKVNTDEGPVRVERGQTTTLIPDAHIIPLLVAGRVEKVSPGAVPVVEQKPKSEDDTESGGDS